MKNVPLMGVQTGRRLAVVGDPIIDPTNLQIVAWYATGNAIGFHPAVVFSEDIHELGHLGAIVDSADDILPLDDLVRLQEILDYGFALYNLPVYDITKKKLGNVESFNFDSDDFLIKQIIVKPSLGVRFTSPQLIITRSQIVELNNEKLVVDSAIRVVKALKTPAKVKKIAKKQAKKSPKPATEPAYNKQ
jgi:sporulation protein YlmC with PRC-barrel domain